jgi:transposase-like protein
MRYSEAEKMEITRTVEGSELSLKQTLEELQVNRSSFYEWYRRYREDRYDGLAVKAPHLRRFWKDPGAGEGTDRDNSLGRP